MPKMSGYVKIFKNKDEGKDKSNKLMFFCINDEKLLEKYKAIWTKIEDLKSIELNSLPVYDDRYKNQNKNIVNELYTNFCGLNVPKDDIDDI